MRISIKDRPRQQYSLTSVFGSSGEWNNGEHWYYCTNSRPSFGKNTYSPHHGPHVQQIHHAPSHTIYGKKARAVYGRVYSLHCRAANKKRIATGGIGSVRIRSVNSTSDPISAFLNGPLGCTRSIKGYVIATERLGAAVGLSVAPSNPSDKSGGDGQKGNGRPPSSGRRRSDLGNS